MFELEQRLGPAVTPAQRPGRPGYLARAEPIAQWVGAQVARRGQAEPALADRSGRLAERERGGVDGVGEQLAAAGGAQPPGDAQQLDGCAGFEAGEPTDRVGGAIAAPALQQRDQDLDGAGAAAERAATGSPAGLFEQRRCAAGRAGPRTTRWARRCGSRARPVRAPRRAAPRCAASRARGPAPRRPARRGRTRPRAGRAVAGTRPCVAGGGRRAAAVGLRRPPDRRVGARRRRAAAAPRRRRAAAGPRAARRAAPLSGPAPSTCRNTRA